MLFEILVVLVFFFLYLLLASEDIEQFRNFRQRQFEVLRCNLDCLAFGLELRQPGLD